MIEGVWFNPEENQFMCIENLEGYYFPHVHFCIGGIEVDDAIFEKPDDVLTTLEKNHWERIGDL